LPYLACYHGVRQTQSFTESDLTTATGRVKAFGAAMDEDIPTAPAPKALDDGTRTKNLFPVLTKLTSSKPLKLFVAGDRSKVGKSR